MKGPNSVDRHVGKRLRLLRHARGMELQALAQAIGVTEPRLFQLEAGRERINATLMRKLSTVLRARPSEFFAGFSADGPAAELPAPGSRDEEEARLVRDFARISDPKSRSLILVMVATYAEFGDLERR